MQRASLTVAIALALTAAAGASSVRIIQTNSAGTTVHVIDPATNKVVGIINGIEVNHGATSAPDGSRFYISNEAEKTLDVVDTKTLKVIKSIPLTAHPNNVSISKDGKRVYVAIAAAPGAVDVIDTATMTRAKSIPVKGSAHNTYVTPDGKYVICGLVAGSIRWTFVPAEFVWMMRTEDAPAAAQRATAITTVRATRCIENLRTRLRTRLPPARFALRRTGRRASPPTLHQPVRRI